jgi:hypothetical protein
MTPGTSERTSPSFCAEGELRLTTNASVERPTAAASRRMSRGRLGGGREPSAYHVGDGGNLSTNQVFDLDHPMRVLRCRNSASWIAQPEKAPNRQTSPSYRQKESGCVLPQAAINCSSPIVVRALFESANQARVH